MGKKGKRSEATCQNTKRLKIFLALGLHKFFYGVNLASYLFRNRIRIDIAEYASFVEDGPDFWVVDASVFAEEIFRLASEAQADEMKGAVEKAVGRVGSAGQVQERRKRHRGD